jgi:hypothetical protein
VVADSNRDLDKNYSRILGRIILGVIFVLMSSGCSTVSNLERHRQLVQNVGSNNYKKSLELVSAKEFFPEERSALLRLLEIGNVSYRSGNYYRSLKVFEAASKLGDNLFTKSITSAAMGAFDSNMDEFYGRKYEHSLIRFYESLDHYNLYCVGKYESSGENYGDKSVYGKGKILSEEERRFHFVAAKSIVKGWNFLLNSYENENYGKAVYKSDLLEKIWGAFIHEESGSYGDRQIALGLYRQAKTVLARDYGIYPIFNAEYEKFRENFRRQSDSAYAVEIRKKHTKETTYARDLYKYIDDKIEKLQNNRSSNLTILLKDGLVVEKKSKPSTFLIDASMFKSFGGEEVWKYFEGELKAETTVNLSIPVINYRNTKNKFEAVLFDLQGNIVEKIPIVLVLPVSDIAFYEIDREIASETDKIMATTSAKYATAVYSSYKLYSQFQDKKMGLTFAAKLFATEKLLIDASSEPDLRQWLTLPGNIRIGSGYLNTGNYLLKIYSIDDASQTEVYSRKINIGQDTTFVDVNL